MDTSKILKHLNSLSNIKDRLIFALQSEGRLDWRLRELTTETDENKLDDDLISVFPPKKKTIFTKCKSDIKYGQQAFKLADPELKKSLILIFQ